MLKQCNTCLAEKSVDDFYKKRGCCKPCAREKWKQYRLNNREQCNRRSAKWHLKNIDTTGTERKKKWRMNNQDKINAKSARRRARKMLQTSPTAEDKKIEIFYWFARKISKIMGEEYHVDHIYPMARGGLHHQDNLQVMLGIDNIRKGCKIQTG